MSRSHRIQNQTRLLIIEFIEKQFPKEKREGNFANFESLEALDLPFVDHWKRLYTEHQSCGVCAKNADCILGDAIRILRPHQITGVPELLREYLLKNGRFDPVTGRGRILLGL